MNPSLFINVWDIRSYPFTNIQKHFNHTADVNGDDGS